MNRPRTFQDQRRTIGMHLGAALSRLRTAVNLNLEDASEERIRREAEKAVDALGPLIWRTGRPNG